MASKSPKKDIKVERRERFLRNLIEESIVNVLAEQEPASGGGAVPPSPVQPSPQTNLPSPPPPEGEEQQPEVFTVEDMVDKLNVIRGGKSFADPEVFGRITTYFNSMADEEKQLVDKFLTEFGAVVIDATEDELEGEEQQRQVARASGQGVARAPGPPAPRAPQPTPVSAPAPVTPTPSM